MTDGWLMDAECIHGNVWYECRQCMADEAARLCIHAEAEQAKNLRAARRARRLMWWCIVWAVANIGLAFVSRWWWLNVGCGVVMGFLIGWNRRIAERFSRLADDFGAFALELRYHSSPDLEDD